jgi:peptide/nickel transport system permease protein
MPTFLATDILFFLLLAGLGLGVFHMARREHLRRPWRKVARSPSAMGSLVILLAFVLIAALDSVRFLPAIGGTHSEGAAQYRSEPQSLLDLWLAPIQARTEKTYSAPLSAYAYAKEMVRQPDGEERWDYPRLLHGGAHLADPARELKTDILATGAKGLAEGLAVWLVPVGLGLAALAWRTRGDFGQRCAAMLRGEDELPWRTVALVALLICLMGGAMGELGLKYHVLGTGKVGEDVFCQSLKSIRTGLLIGT